MTTRFFHLCLPRRLPLACLLALFLCGSVAPLRTAFAAPAPASGTPAFAPPGTTAPAVPAAAAVLKRTALAPAVPAPLAPAVGAPMAGSVAAAPKPAQRAAPNAALHCGGQAAAPGKLALPIGKSTLLRLPEAVSNRSVGNPAVLQAMLVAPDTLYVLGTDVGSTNMIVQGRSGVCSVIEVTVGVDTAGLQAALAELLPAERNIRVSAAADALVLSGEVEDAPTLARVMELAQAYVRRPAQALAATAEGAQSEPSAAPSAASGARASPQPAAGVTEGGGAQGRIVNLLSVSAPQQVMLEVKVAEVSKTLLDKLEGSALLHRGVGSWTASVLSNFLSGATGGGLMLGKPDGSRLRVDGERHDALVRILAEPTVMAISGQEGSFLAGGKVLIPVGQDNNRVTLQEKEFGVGLRFTPTVLSGGRIHLKVAPEVSELSREGVGISAAGLGGSSVLPLITTRRAATTLQLFDGQSFAIGGLIRHTQSGNLQAMPVLGEVPVLGALFRSTDFQQDRTELLFVVTAHLVKPLPPGYGLPTDGPPAPGRSSLMLNGRLEGAAPPAASPNASSAPRDSGFQLK
ncbi:type II and III secretion system protein family protein [Massilia sp. MB5]|uniref:type II and III secretion system protein family protein n=1 Tax=Massilia sp. MB5 TaxID=2919578 RepID=UPI001F111217|nr:type II and III secretion system protein family protein [Massilia sp. MB5]UMR32106.1 type II and III secretion system protein family protein [Massilia sp. MB5]